MPHPQVDKILANAELAIKTFDLKYDEESVKWIDEFVERLRKSSHQSGVDKLISVLGSFVGECARREFGGEWKEVNGQWGIRFDPPGVVAFPFNKIAKQFESGHEGGDSILGFYQSIRSFF